jgi:signal transduction histidine kinase
VVAFVVLWMRRRSTLDLWVLVVLCTYAMLIPTSYFSAPVRFSVGWYVVRSYAVLSSSLVLIFLLYEITTLYARPLGAVLAQRHEREARLMTVDAVAATIAREVRQPLTGMLMSADVGLRFLNRDAPDLDRAKEAFRRISVDGQRAAAVITSIRAISKNDLRNRTPLDVSELVQEALALVHGDLQKHEILVQAEPNRQLPKVQGDQVQLRQVLLNLITNAIDAMAANDEPRLLSVKSETCEGDGVLVSVAEESALWTSRRYSARLSRRSPTAWAWDCRSAGRSSRLTTAGCGPRRTFPGALYFNSCCTPAVRYLPASDTEVSATPSSNRSRFTLLI